MMTLLEKRVIEEMERLTEKGEDVCEDALRYLFSPPKCYRPFWREIQKKENFLFIVIPCKKNAFDVHIVMTLHYSLQYSLGLITEVLFWKTN